MTPRGDIDQEEIDGERRLRRQAITLLLALIVGALIWGFCK